MDSVFTMLQRVSIFILAASLVTNLFAETEYKKYFQYAAGLMVIAMVITPVLALAGEKNNLESWVGNRILDQKAKETEDKIRLLGKEYEKTAKEQFEKQMKQDIAKQCGVGEEDCEVIIDNNRIEQIRVWVSRMPEDVSMRISRLAIRYGLSEDAIFIQEGER